MNKVHLDITKIRACTVLVMRMRIISIFEFNSILIQYGIKHFFLQIPSKISKSFCVLRHASQIMQE